MKISPKTTRLEFAAIIVQQLKKHKISCVLVGGSCVSIYTNEKHFSHDLDFISPNSHQKIEESLKEIGFQKKDRYFKHLDSEFYVEFPTGPVSIGEQSPVKPDGKIKFKNATITLLSPSQCVMDRLSAFFHWNDRRSLIHALWVCSKHPVNIAKISRWAKNEKSSEKFAEFLEQYKKLKGKK